MIDIDGNSHNLIMNEIQEKLLSIAKEYIRICSLLGLRYFAWGGTCLGAVRHHGFIPWDDDMDFAMPREDFEILRKKWSAYANDRYFFQTQESDPYYFYNFGKIRDCSTTAIECSLQGYPINHGLWIDIFPIDGYPANKRVFYKMAMRSRVFYRRRYLSHLYPINGFWRRAFQVIITILFPSKKLARYLDIKQYRKFSFDMSTMVCVAPFSGEDPNPLNQAWFTNYLIVSFEGMPVRVPIGYREELTQLYGDWQTPPPEKERVGHHHCVVLDLSKPYTDYTKIRLDKDNTTSFDNSKATKS